MISAEEMVDKAKDPARLVDRVHKSGKSVGRTELDLEDETETGDGE